MADKQVKPENVDDYIAGFPALVQERLLKIRETIRAAAPEARETIKYGMPTYVLAGNLVFFAAYKRHLAIYPVPTGDAAFQADLAAFRAEKSTARFPLDEPLPLGLIGNLVRFLVIEQLDRSASKP